MGARFVSQNNHGIAIYEKLMPSLVGTVISRSRGPLVWEASSERKVSMSSSALL